MNELEEQYVNEVLNKSDDRTDLVTVTYNRQHFTERTLMYLLNRTVTPYRLTVVDNGSTDGTVDYLLRMKAAGKIDNLILLDKNYGLEYARNTALRHVHSDYCVFFDNDLLAPKLEPDWLSQEIGLMKKHPEFGCIALRPQIIVGVNEAEIFAQEGEVVPNNHVGATFMMFPTSLLKEVKWEDTFTNRVADWRLGDLLKEKGLKMGWARNICCYHMYEKNWGYDEKTPHFHRVIHPPSEAYDREVDMQTMEPL